MKHSTKLICLVAVILAGAAMLLFAYEAISLRATVGTLMTILALGCAAGAIDEYSTIGKMVDLSNESQ